MSDLGKLAIGHWLLVCIIGYGIYALIGAVLKILVAKWAERYRRPVPGKLDAGILAFSSCVTVMLMYGYGRGGGVMGFLTPAIFTLSLLYIDYRQLNHQHIEPLELQADLLGTSCGFLLAGVWHWQQYY